MNGDEFRKWYLCEWMAGENYRPSRARRQNMREINELPQERHHLLTRISQLLKEVESSRARVAELEAAQAWHPASEPPKYGGWSMDEINARRKPAQGEESEA